jgi:Na+/H+ antiporter NhaD/arsenite permease-like protein
MIVAIIITFIVGYACIALEHPLKVNKTASALLLGVVLWVMFALSMNIFGAGFNISDPESWHVFLKSLLIENLGETAETVFFLLGAMTIVSLIDNYQGFSIITDRIKTTNRKKLLWILSILTFFLSALLDNMTTAIVMCALLRKLIKDEKERWLFAGMVILAANAGGAWSPIGDVTTIMLWIGGQVTTVNIMLKTIVASLVSMAVPVFILSLMPVMKGEIERPDVVAEDESYIPREWRMRILIIGICGLVFVPIFKTITHLPPYLGMLFSLSVLWVITEVASHRRHLKEEGEGKPMPTVMSTLEHVDTPTVLFFLGILMAVSALNAAGILGMLSNGLSDAFLGKSVAGVSGFFLIDIIIGILSSIIDNVPLVAATMKMYPIVGENVMFATDHAFWECLAYCAGTGGSLLIIGSAAGVAVMGIEKIDFIWYLKKISWLALVGYLAGVVSYILMYIFLFEPAEAANAAALMAPAVVPLA